MQKSKKELLNECARLGIIINERQHTPEELQTFISNKQKGLVNYFKASDILESEEYPNETFQEVRVLRDKKSGAIEICDIVRCRIKFSAREAAIINEMRLSNMGNVVFTLFVRPGTSRIVSGKPKKVSTGADIRQIQTKFEAAANHGLLLEVVSTAMRTIKTNPELTLSAAFSIGFNEWVK